MTPLSRGGAPRSLYLSFMGLAALTFVARATMFYFQNKLFGPDGSLGEVEEVMRVLRGVGVGVALLELALLTVITRLTFRVSPWRPLGWIAILTVLTSLVQLLSGWLEWGGLFLTLNAPGGILELAWFIGLVITGRRRGGYGRGAQLAGVFAAALLSSDWLLPFFREPLAELGFVALSLLYWLIPQIGLVGLTGLFWIWQTHDDDDARAPAPSPTSEAAEGLDVYAMALLSRLLLAVALALMLIFASLGQTQLLEPLVLVAGVFSVLSLCGGLKQVALHGMRPDLHRQLGAAQWWLAGAAAAGLAVKLWLTYGRPKAALVLVSGVVILIIAATAVIRLIATLRRASKVMRASPANVFD